MKTKTVFPRIVVRHCADNTRTFSDEIHIYFALHRQFSSHATCHFKS